jgi:hypothetical protein
MKKAVTIVRPPRRHSCGRAHSIAVKRGMKKWREHYTDEQWRAIHFRAKKAARYVGMWRGMVALLGKLNVPIPSPDDIERELRTSYQRGYVQALRDVKREREKQEAQSYAEAMNTISFQEACKISHVYEQRSA